MTTPHPLLETELEIVLRLENCMLVIVGIELLIDEPLEADISVVKESFEVDAEILMVVPGHLPLNAAPSVIVIPPSSKVLRSKGVPKKTRIHWLKPRSTNHHVPVSQPPIFRPDQITNLAPEKKNKKKKGLKKGRLTRTNVPTLTPRIQIT